MGRLVTERSKEVASIASGAGLPSASGCKDPMYQDILSPLCSWTMFRSFFYAQFDCRFLVGIIPHAHAGETERMRWTSGNRRAHPHSRGENGRLVISVVTMVGSSPLTRGKLCACVVRALLDGLIPAHAGKTESRRPRTRQARAHPRSCGENEPAVKSFSYSRGSSPLMRGKHALAIARLDSAGLIPTHTGETRS